jgi:CobW/HypB/UreG, nucleotide-binding domain
LVEVRKNVLKANDVVARELRERFRNAGVFGVSLVSSPGSGKTAFLERILTLLNRQCRVAALVEDLATENDAIRLTRSQAPVKQIVDFQRRGCRYPDQNRFGASSRIQRGHRVGQHSSGAAGHASVQGFGQKRSRSRRIRGLPPFTTGCSTPCCDSLEQLSAGIRELSRDGVI